ncbi:MAG: aminotransferase class IV [Opitutae bacterium]|jgi:branched-subunit amino acid aminotransferase/4-amino-4-deoxychorismate lyase|nr:aminotransferase class IV [Opitutae bacterium]MBT5377999.1 aminotransferase class IV [Opitutae bacterium]
MAKRFSPIAFQGAWGPNRNPIPFVNPWGYSGAYTTILVEGTPSTAVFFDRHLERLRQSLNKLKLPQQFSESFLKETILGVISSCNQGPYMLRVALIKKGLFLSTYAQSGKGAELEGELCHIQRKLPAAKSLLDMGLFKEMQKVDRNCKELLLISPNGNILEGATTNILFVRGRTIISPTQDALPGITRQVIQELIPESWCWNTNDVHLDDLHKFDEILVCGSGKEVAQIISLSKIEWKPTSQNAFNTLSQCYKGAKLNYLKKFSMETLT